MPFPLVFGKIKKLVNSTKNVFELLLKFILTEKLNSSCQLKFYSYRENTKVDSTIILYASCRRTDIPTQYFRFKIYDLDNAVTHLKITSNNEIRSEIIKENSLELTSKWKIHVKAGCGPRKKKKKKKKKSLRRRLFSIPT